MKKVYMYLDTKKGMFVITSVKVPFRISATIAVYELADNTTASELAEFTAGGYKDTKNIKKLEK